MTKKLESTQDVIDALRKEQEKANQQRVKQGLGKIRTLYLGFKIYLSNLNAKN